MLTRYQHMAEFSHYIRLGPCSECKSVKFLTILLIILQARGSDYVVLWLDCDKEGENICFEVLDAIMHVMTRPRGNEQVK